MPAMQPVDRDMMQRCIALSVRSGREGEYPYGVVICRDRQVIAESINRVAHARILAPRGVRSLRAPLEAQPPLR